MLRATWTAGSLRLWVFVGMALTAVPLLISAVVGYAILSRGVIADFQDVAARQRDQIIPVQQLRLGLWEATDPILLYLDDGDPAHAKAYRALRETTESGFAGVHRSLESEPEARAIIERAQADWMEADHLAAQILSRHWTPGDVNGDDLAKRFDSAIAAAVDRLGAVSHDLSIDLDRDHRDAQLSYERSRWVTGIAAGVSLVLMILGVVIIGRYLLSSVDRLVDGAARFAAGDRDHRIEIRVPPELHRVAEEFNHMIVRIRDSEAALADAARRDRLTGLLNRRALEVALADALARRKRLNEAVALLLLDIDHFKRVNDTHGHAAGDVVLRAVATALTSGVREIDKVFRFGGEEFVVLLYAADRTAALATAERLRAAVAAQPIATDGHTIPVTISVGLATALDEDSDGLLRAADAALYRAKAEGRNRVVCA
jgi:diguanylate cyclase (GGDEF)-like protein